MQNFESTNRDSISSDEAREVLQAWANRREANGVDANVNSIPALAAGLGVSEEEVRRMVEDIRVQQRSHQIAAGIISQEQGRRKNLDVTAAIGAAVAFIILALLVGGFFVMRSKAVGPASAPVIVDGIPAPPAPPAAIPGGRMTIQSDDGSSVVIDGSNIQIKNPDGNTLSTAQDAVKAEVERQIANAEQQKAEINKAAVGRKLTADENIRMQILDRQIAGFQKVIQKMKAKRSASVGD